MGTSGSSKTRARISSLVVGCLEKWRPGGVEMDGPVGTAIWGSATEISDAPNAPVVVRQPTRTARNMPATPASSLGHDGREAWENFMRSVGSHHSVSGAAAA